MSIIDIAHLDVVIGNKPFLAFPFLDKGISHSEIKEKTGASVCLDNVNISIKQGEIFAIMGSVGSGASVLLNAINGLIPMSRGTIDVNLNCNGIEVRHSLKTASNADLRQLRMHHITTVFKKPALVPWKSVRENIEYPLVLAGTHPTIIKQRVKKNLEQLNLTAVAHHYPHELTHGMAHRVAIARALATDADIVLLDEPGALLFPSERAELFVELLTLHKIHRKTFVLVSSHFDDALALNSRVAVMEKGTIAQVGLAEEIAKNPKTAYGKRLVAHLDRTKLLRAKTIMTALKDLQVRRDDSSILLDHAGTYRCYLDELGRPRRSLCGDLEGRLIPWTRYQCGSLTENDLVLGHEHLMIDELIIAMAKTKRPLIIQDKSGKMVGAVTNDAIVHALAMK